MEEHPPVRRKINERPDQQNTDQQPHRFILLFSHFYLMEENAPDHLATAATRAKISRQTGRCKWQEIAS
jgi:hypothetical protein